MKNTIYSCCIGSIIVNIVEVLGMKYLLIYSVHGVIWSGYSICTLLSEGDRLEFKIIILFIFFYFAFIFARSQGVTKLFSFNTTVISLMMFLAGKLLFQSLYFTL